MEVSANVSANVSVSSRYVFLVSGSFIKILKLFLAKDRDFSEFFPAYPASCCLCW